LIERTNLSAKAFRFGLRGGRRTGFTPEALSEARMAWEYSGSLSMRR